MRFLKWISGVLGLVVLFLVGVTAVLLLVNKLPWEVSWDLWVVLTAVGTIGATLVALVLALQAWRGGKSASARLISAWVTDEYVAKSDGSAYERVVHLHIANESNEPAFRAVASVCIGRANTPLGPLSAPSPIAVLPARRELVFDISVPLLAHPDSWSVKASLTFSDPRGRMWVRDIDGTLRDVTRKKQRWSKLPDSEDTRQLGEVGSLFNPYTTVLALLSIRRLEHRHYCD